MPQAPVPTPQSADATAALRQAVIDTCLEMNALGVNQGSSGNVSVCIPGGFLITPSGVPYRDMRPEQIVEMDLEAGYRGDWLPSSEWRLHHDLYRARPEAGAVVHTHSTYATAYSCLRRDLPAFHYMIGVAGGDSLRCAAYATFGTQALSDAMLEAIEGRTACLLANHGAICFGPTLGKALALAVEVETLCKQYAIVRGMGEPTLIESDEMARVLRRMRTYGKQTHELEGAGPDAAVEAPTRRDAPARRDTRRGRRSP